MVLRPRSKAREAIWFFISVKCFTLRGALVWRCFFLYFFPKKFSFPLHQTPVLTNIWSKYCFKIEHAFNYAILNKWSREETREPEANPCRHRENMQRNSEIKPGTPKRWSNPMLPFFWQRNTIFSQLLQLDWWQYPRKQNTHMQNRRNSIVWCISHLEAIHFAQLHNSPRYNNYLVVHLTMAGIRAGSHLTTPKCSWLNQSKHQSNVSLLWSA